MQTIDPTTGKKIKTYLEIYTFENRQCSKNGLRNLFGPGDGCYLKERGVMMKKAAEILRRDKDQYARLMAQEMGKPLARRGKVKF